MKRIEDIVEWEQFKVEGHFYFNNVGEWMQKGNNHSRWTTEELALQFIAYKLNKPKMKAHEAKQLAKTAMASENDMADIHKVIKAAAGSGKMETFYYKEINGLQRKSLEVDGYKVTGGLDRDGILYTISWNH